MSTILELISKARTELVEPTEGFYTNAELRDWLNEANREAQTMARIDTEPTTTSLLTVAGTDAYSLPANFGFPIRVERQIEDDRYLGLNPVHTINARVESRGIPEAWTIHNNKLRIFPTPDSAIQLRLWFTLDAPTLGDSDTPAIPAKYHRLLYYYTMSQAARKANDPAWELYKTDYEEGLRKMVRELDALRNGPHYPTVVDLG